ncbi:MAG TPA: ATP-binding protein [Steroidobacteraceae bacterium]|nr:ATP-binding protein [Steroidobacteraceae bacterium]
MHLVPPEEIRVDLEDLPDALLVVDERGTIRFANRNAAELFGRAPHELQGQSVEVLMPARFRAGHSTHRHKFNARRTARAMGGSRLDLFGQRADGSEFPVAISLKPILWHAQWLTVAAIRDMTSRVESERKLEEALEQARRASVAKSRFLATASHDLRQPLQTLALLTGALRRVVPDHPAATEALGQQDRAIASMSHLMDSLLDICKLESGAVRAERNDFTLNALFEELRQEFASVAASKGLTLEVTACEESACSDVSLVGQILRNLLSNAIKYTRAGKVALRCMRESAASLRIEVLDTGVGIAADDLRCIFDEFFQVCGPHNPMREGYGLGLSIVQRLVTLLDLKLEVQSEFGRGSVFALRVPVGRKPARRARPLGVQSRVNGAAARPAAVLLVEDDAGVRNATRMLLQSEGYAITAVASLADAIEHARQDPPVNLLLSDYHLGNNETGTQVIASVREALGRPLKAVLVTGDTSAAIQRLPADAHTRIASKPVTAEELLGLIRELLTAA